MGAIKLAVDGMVHANLGREHVVYVKYGRPVHCSIPAEFNSYQEFRDKIDEQRQLCDVVDSIVEQGPEGTGTQE